MFLNGRSPRLAERFEGLLAAHQRTLAVEYPPSSVDRWERLGIVGAGVMGTAIAARALRHDLGVILADASESVLAAVPQRVAAAMAQASGPGTGPPWLDRLQTTSRLADLAAADVVLESVPEDPAVKGRLYAALEPHLASRCVLASNTSTVRIELLAKGLAHPQRFCGLHFFYPVQSRPLVEVIAGPETGADTLAAAVDFARRMGMIPLRVGDGYGFVVNRLLQAYLGDALQLLMDGAAPEAVDEAAQRFGMAWGPLRMLDEIGLDTALNCAWIFAGAFPQIVPTTPLLVAMVKARRLGRKSGAGFYVYEGEGVDAVPRYDPQCDGVLGRWTAPRRIYASEEIAARLILPMLLEATRLLADGTAARPSDVDLGIVLGLGFPQDRGGLLLWADEVGAARIVAHLAPLGALGARMLPTPLLLEMAAEGRKFYPTR